MIKKHSKKDSFYLTNFVTCLFQVQLIHELLPVLVVNCYYCANSITCNFACGHLLHVANNGGQPGIKYFRDLLTLFQMQTLCSGFIRCDSKGSNLNLLSPQNSKLHIGNLWFTIFKVLNKSRTIFTQLSLLSFFSYIFWVTF